MCLLIAIHRVCPDAPLIIAANRDEFLARPATTMTVLQEKNPRVVGGKDLLAQGTWLATNEHGVIAGLTNAPTGRRDPTKRSRGELPLALAQHQDVKSAVAAFVQRFRPADYNPAWLLVGDRTTLYYIDMTPTPDNNNAPVVHELPPGIHILENKALTHTSAKVAHVRKLLRDLPVTGEPAGLIKNSAEIIALLQRVLADHHTDNAASIAAYQAPCVHAGPYGTRSAEIIQVPAPSDQAPSIWIADGPPCTATFQPQVDVW